MSIKRFFRPPKWSKMIPQKSQNEQIFDPKFQIFGVIYQPFELKIYPILGLSWSKNNAQTLPKQLQNNFEKVQKSTFFTPKMVKNGSQKCQNEQILDHKF